MGAIITLGSSIVAIALILAFKDWELRHRTRLFFVFRNRLNATLVGSTAFFTSTMPAIVRFLAHHSRREIRAAASHSLHLLFVRLEHALERMLRHLRYQRIRTTPREPSMFLQDVAEHKRTLDRTGI